MNERINFASAGATRRTKRTYVEIAKQGNTDMTFQEIATEYRLYDTLPAFQKGHEDYMDGNFECPYTNWRCGGFCQRPSMTRKPSLRR